MIDPGQEYAMNQVGLIDRDLTENLFKMKMKTGFPEKGTAFTNESNITVVDSHNFTSQTANKDTKVTSSQAYFEKSSKNNYTRSKPAETFVIKDTPGDIKEW